MTFFLAVALLRYDLSPGLTRTYEVTRAFQALDMTENTTFVDQLRFKVSDQKTSDRSRLSVTFLPLKTILDGQTFPAPKEAKPLELGEQRTFLGEVFERQLMAYDTILRERHNRVADIVFPVAEIQVGTTWSRNVAAIDDTFPAATWTWTCTKLSKDTADINIAFSETSGRDPLSATGAASVDLRSGWPESIAISIPETTVPGDSEPLKVKLALSWKRVS